MFYIVISENWLILRFSYLCRDYQTFDVSERNRNYF